MEKFPSGEFCRQHSCSDCCKVVKMKKGFKSHIGEGLKDLPFKDRKEIWISEKHPETVKLETFDCDLYDEKDGLCKDYENRRDICKKTTCTARVTEDVEKQKELIKKFKQEKFIICKERK